jgi:AcrR family transcriptional regulator
VEVSFEGSLSSNSTHADFNECRVPKVSVSRPTKRTGRRPGVSDTRDQIATAARTLFAEVGYEQTTFRRIATTAGVDPALVVHFFGSKDELFRHVVALPQTIADALERLAEGPRETVGRRVAEVITSTLEDPVSRTTILARIRATTTHPYAAELVRETVTQDLARLAAALTDDRPHTRAVLAGAQIVGLTFTRYVLQAEPLASMSPAEITDHMAPVFQHYLVEPLIS